MKIIPYFVPASAGGGGDASETITFDSALLPHAYLSLGEYTASWLADEYQGISHSDCMTFITVDASTVPNPTDPDALVLRLRQYEQGSIINGSITTNTILTRDSADGGGYSLDVELAFRDYYQDPPDNPYDSMYTGLDVAAIHDAVTGERIAAICANLRPSAIDVWIEVTDSAGSTRTSPSTAHQVESTLAMKLTVVGRNFTLDTNGEVINFLAPSVFPDSGETTVKLLKMTEHEFPLVREVDIYKVRLARLP